MSKTKSALKILDRVTGESPALRRDIADARIHLEVAQSIYDLRTKAGLSQRQLAERIGSQQPVIARLEDADYQGHSLTMLQRIAEALEQRLEVRFVSSRKRRAPKSRRSARPSPRRSQPA